MTDRTPVVVGVGMTPFAANREDSNARDLATEAVLACLADAGLENMSAIQHGLTSYESDHFHRVFRASACPIDHLPE